MNREEVENNISCVRLSVANVLCVGLCLGMERRKWEKKSQENRFSCYSEPLCTYPVNFPFP